MKLIDADALLKDMQSCCSPKQFGRSAAKMCIKHAKDLIRALRCKSVSEECAYFNCPYFEKIPTVGCVYSRIICHRERARDVAADTIECLEAENAALGEQIAEKSKEIERYKQWVNDLQSGMYVNCVYCGHRYGPADTAPVSMAEVLKQHVEQCPAHPMSQLKTDLARVTAERDSLRAQQQQPDVVHGRWVHIKEDGMTVAGKCSNCGYTIFNDSDETNYCPSCGAKMD